MTVLFKNAIEKNNLKTILPRFILKLRKIRIALEKFTIKLPRFATLLAEFVPIPVKFAIIKAYKQAEKVS